MDKKKKNHNPFNKQFECKGCGQTFIPKDTRYNQYCSRECAFKYKRGENHHLWKPRIVKEIPKCKICGRLVGTSNKCYCSDECRKEQRCIDQFKRSPKGLASKNIVCLECGHTFIPTFRDKRKTFCSDACCNKYNKRLYGNSNTRRARHYGCVCDPVNPIRVFIRDGWTCQLCNKRLNSKDRGSFKDRAPELDHIIPLSKGGPHTYKNTQCLCRKCNQEKGANERGQLRLFG